MRTTVQILSVILTAVICIFVIPESVIEMFNGWLHIAAFLVIWGLWILVAQKVFEFAYLDWLVPLTIIASRILLCIV